MAIPRTNASRDDNFTPTLIGVSSSDGKTPVPVEVDPTTGAILVSGGTGGGGTSNPNGQATMANSGPVVIASDQSTIPVAEDTSVLYSGTTALTPKKALITASASGATQLVAAVASKKIRVTGLVLIANAAVNVKFQSHVTPTDLTGLLYLAANTGFSAAPNIRGHFETVAGEALDINLSGAIAVGGFLTYVEVS